MLWNFAQGTKICYLHHVHLWFIKKLRVFHSHWPHGNVWRGRMIRRENQKRHFLGGLKHVIGHYYKSKESETIGVTFVVWSYNEYPLNLTTWVKRYSILVLLYCNHIYLQSSTYTNMEKQKIMKTCGLTGSNSKSGREKILRSLTYNKEKKIELFWLYSYFSWSLVYLVIAQLENE